MMSINSLGFRDDEVKPKKRPNEFRILGLGDSITVQDYLPKNQTYLDLLQQQLNKDSSIHFEVINSAIGNIGLQEELAILEDDGISTQPDLVLLGLYLNDTRPPWGFSGETGDKGWLRKHSLLVETVLKNIEEKKWADENKKEIRFGWIKDKESLDWKNKSSDFQKLITAAQYDWGHAWQKDAQEILSKQFEQLANFARAHGFKVAVVHFPVTFQIDAHDSLDAPQKFAATLSQKYNFSYLDLLPELKGKKSEELYYDHCHPNAKGSKIIARSIERFFRKGRLLPQEKPRVPVS
jgi:lysophospholipase L1-like esterase